MNRLPLSPHRNNAITDNYTYFDWVFSQIRTAYYRITSGRQTILLPLKSSGSESVFPGRSDGRIRLYWIWNAVRRKAGLTDVRLHDLRHSYATRAVEVGISMPVIARLLGHSTIWTTSRYLHASERVVEKAATEVSASISQIFD